MTYNPKSAATQFQPKITQDDIDFIIKLKKQGVDTSIIANSLVGRHNGNLGHPTAYKWIRLDYEKLEAIRKKLR